MGKPELEEKYLSKKVGKSGGFRVSFAFFSEPLSKYIGYMSGAWYPLTSQKKTLLYKVVIIGFTSN